MLRAIALAGSFSLAALVLSIGMIFAGGGIAALAGLKLPAAAAQALGVAGPALAAMLFAAVRGRHGLADLRRSLETMPRFPALTLIPVAYALVAATAAYLSGGEVVLLSPLGVMTAVAIQFAIVALLEEIGWRGYLTPALLNRMTPIAVSVLVALAWFAWHAPKFAIGPVFTSLLFVGCFAHSIIMTAMIAYRRWGFWACVVLHASANLSMVVIDPRLSALSAQYAAFGATTGLSCLLAVVVFRQKAAWFLGSVGTERGVQQR